MEYKIVSPILGFEDDTKAVIARIDDFFSELSVDSASWTVVDPYKLREYDFTIPASYRDLLEIEDLSDVKVYNIVTVLQPLEESTINFLAPIVVNEKKHLLAQIALDEKQHKEYGLRESIKRFF